MEEAPENGKELSNSAHANEMNETYIHIYIWSATYKLIFPTILWQTLYFPGILILIFNKD